MKNLKFSFFLILISSNALYAQDNYLYEQNFTSYSDYISKKCGVLLKMPNNFTDLKKYFMQTKIRNADPGPGVAFLFGPILKADKDCIVGYPYRPDYERITGWVDKSQKDSLAEWREKNAELARVLIHTEVKAALGYPQYLPDLPPKDTIKRIISPRYDTTRIDLNKYVTIIAGKKAKEMFNADTIFVYELPLQKPYEGKYPYCTSLYIYKRNRAALNFRLFFTPNGKKKDEEFINLLSQQIL